MKDATELYLAMLAAVKSTSIPRRTTDSTSPTQARCEEAEFGLTFVLEDPKLNVPTYRRVDLRWAAANLLHFFACTEEAGVLRKYNEHADRFLAGDRWVGAYGPVAVPQIEFCVQLLRRSPQSRRAVVSMGGLDVQDINRPPCWSFLHFLRQEERLHLLVYQRSLNLTGVMPYDCVLLTNVLLYAAERLGMAPGRLHWTVGSLHAPVDAQHLPSESTVSTIAYPVATLSDPRRCMELLEVGL